MNWYARYPGDYRADTADLSLVEHGAYALLLDHYYASDGDMPGELEKLNRICSAVSPAEADAVASVASRFFPVNGDGRRHNGRADREMAKAKAIGDKRRTAAERRWKASPDAIAYANADASAYANGYANEMQLHTHTTYHNPHTTTTTTTTDKPPTPLPPSAAPAAAPPVVLVEKPKRKKQAAEGPPGFQRFWSAWPPDTGPIRKTAKPKCITRWIADGLEDKADHVIAVMLEDAATWEWKKDNGQYRPMTLTWLNQQRWNREPKAQQRQADVEARRAAAATDSEAQRRAAERQAAAEQRQREEQEWADWMARHDMAAVEAAVWAAVDVAPDKIKAWREMPADQRYANLGFRREARRYGGGCVTGGGASSMAELLGVGA